MPEIHVQPSHASDRTSRPAPGAIPPRRRSLARKWLLPASVLAVAAIGFGYWLVTRGAVNASEVEGSGSKAAILPLVEVVHPVAGGLALVINQPGTLQAFQKAALYAKVSGYLSVMNVDYGDRVKKGDVLVEIEVPELHKAVDQAHAALKQSEASVLTAEARIHTAKADTSAARADVAKAEADVKEFVARKNYRQSELNRYIELARERSIEQKLVDEERERYGAAVSAEEAGQANVKAMYAQIEAADARVNQTEADLLAAKANVTAAQADLEKSEIMASYTKITAPYDGVITQRNHFPGAFVRSAADGDPQPLLVVAQTDKFRVGVMIPDLDVPFVDRGDPAIVHISALPGQEFPAKVSRFSDSETESERNMYTEIDLNNDGGKLREGMYGKVTIVLNPASQDAVTIPSGGLIKRDGAGKGAVYVIRDGKVHQKDVQIGKDDGRNVEIISGLTVGDMVVVRYNGSIAEDLAVRAELMIDQPDVAGATDEE